MCVERWGFWLVDVTTGRRSAFFTYDKSSFTALAMSWVSPGSSDLISRKLIAVTSGLLKNHKVLLWRDTDNNICFKMSHHPGFHKLHVRSFDSVISQYANSGIVSLNSVTRSLVSAGINDSVNIAPVLFALLGGPKGTRVPRYFTEPVYVHKEVEIDEPVKVDYVDQAAPALECWPDVYPALCASSSLAAVMYRIYEVNPGTVNIPRHVYRYLDEFIQSLLGDIEGTLEPLTEAEVVERMNTAKTRERMTRAALSEARVTDEADVEAFIKKEAYAEPKDMRNISGVCPQHNLHGFRYG